MATSKDTPAADLYDRLDTALHRARAVHQAHVAALEGAPGALPDGAHFHVGAVVEDLLDEAMDAAQSLRTIASKTALPSAN